MSFLKKIISVFAGPRDEGLCERSPQWSSVRSRYLIVHGSCAACGQDDRSRLAVHHVVPFHTEEGKALELDESNLITLCEDSCHLTFGHLKDWKSWNKDVRKDCERYLAKVRKRP